MCAMSGHLHEFCCTVHFLKQNSYLQELDYLQKQVDSKQMRGKLPFVTQYEALPEIRKEGDSHAPWRPSSYRDLADPELAAILRKAIDCLICHRLHITMLLLICPC